MNSILFAFRVRNRFVARRRVQSGGDGGHVEGPDGAGEGDGGKGTIDSSLTILDLIRIMDNLNQIRIIRTVY